MFHLLDSFVNISSTPAGFRHQQTLVKSNHIPHNIQTNAEKSYRYFSVNIRDYRHAYSPDTLVRCGLQAFSRQVPGPQVIVFQQKTAKKTTMLCLHFRLLTQHYSIDYHYFMHNVSQGYEHAYQPSYVRRIPNVMSGSASAPQNRADSPI